MEKFKYLNLNIRVNCTVQSLEVEWIYTNLKNWDSILFGMDCRFCHQFHNTVCIQKPNKKPGNGSKYSMHTRTVQNILETSKPGLNRVLYLNWCIDRVWLNYHLLNILQANYLMCPDIKSVPSSKSFIHVTSFSNISYCINCE